MSEDKKLLMLAAKAYRREPPIDANGVFMAWIGSSECGHWWNPLEDDGDALRLAVQLGIKFRWHATLHQALAWLPLGDEVQVNCEDFNGDEFAATRRAIVHAAAEIGKTRA
jgi:hypothetical protein